MSDGRATRKQLEELYGLLLTHLLRTLRTAQPGELRASFLNVVRAFLADSGINAESIRSSKDGAEALSALIKGLPDFRPLERHKAN
jgi:hypothetical protein